MLILFAALKPIMMGIVRSFIWLLQASGSIYNILRWVKDMTEATQFWHSVALRNS